MTDFEFNIIEWWGKHVDFTIPKIDEDNEDKRTELKMEEYKIYTFGRTETGKSVECIITGFNPYYFVKIPEECNKSDEYVKRKFCEYIKEKYYKANGLYLDVFLEDQCEIVRDKDLGGFSNEKIFRFIKLVFSSEKSMNSSKYSLFKDPLKIEGINQKNIKFQLYESNFKPFIRLAHLKDIKMSGWCIMKKSEMKILKETESKIKFEINWEKIKGKQVQKIAPFVQMSWDIEVYSHDYTFPDPKQEFKLNLENLIKLRMEDISQNNVRSIKNKLMENLDRSIDFKAKKITFTQNDEKIVVLLKKNSTIIQFRNNQIDLDIISLKGKKYYYDKVFRYHIDDLKIFPNEIYQIGIIIRNFGEKEIKKILLTSKQCDEIEDAEVIEAKNEMDLIKDFLRIVKKYDPDILWGYNTDSFDFDYLIKRAQLLGNNLKTDILRQMSRSEDLVSYLKTDNFSSSAYGDNEFKRLYIPGRLNYDLLIHFKRGIKKYSSYKLNDIAFEILNETKHDVSPKEIFRAYEKNDPKDIKRIGEYCIQDTVLLQNLVDNQIILTNTIQMSNITWVPISYLITKGQTIKVLSQIMKKSMEMGFKVPHTNFNTDKNLLTVKLRKEYDIEFLTDLVGKSIRMDCGKKEIEYEIEGVKAKMKTDYIVNGIVEEIKDKKCLKIKSDTILEENESIKTIKKAVVENKFLEVLSISIEDVDQSFTGATVLPPVKGIHLCDVVVEDFASLYPTIMMSRNLCFSTLINEEEWSEQRLKELGIKYEVIEWDDTVKYKLNKKCSKYMSKGKNEGSLCGKDSVFNISEYKLSWCSENCIPLIYNENKNTDKLEIKKIFKQERLCDCKAKAKKTDSIFDYCLKCFNKKCKAISGLALMNFKNSILDLDIDTDKCEKCGKKAKIDLILKGDNYVCLVHDPSKKNRDPNEKELKKDVKYRYLIAQPNGETNKGVIASLLEDLYMERKKVKKEMYKVPENNKELKEIMDCQQLSIKISLNSVYGFMGRTTGNLVREELGRITTAIGRELIQNSKDFVEKDYQNRICNVQELICEELTENEKELFRALFRKDLEKRAQK